jgi:hypothetical protein
MIVINFVHVCHDTVTNSQFCKRILLKLFHAQDDLAARLVDVENLRGNFLVDLQLVHRARHLTPSNFIGGYSAN